MRFFRGLLLAIFLILSFNTVYSYNYKNFVDKNISVHYWTAEASAYDHFINPCSGGWCSWYDSEPFSNSGGWQGNVMTSGYNHFTFLLNSTFRTISDVKLSLIAKTGVTVQQYYKTPDAVNIFTSFDNSTWYLATSWINPVHTCSDNAAGGSTVSIDILNTTKNLEAFKYIKVELDGKDCGTPGYAAVIDEIEMYIGDEANSTFNVPSCDLSVDKNPACFDWSLGYTDFNVSLSCVGGENDKYFAWKEANEIGQNAYFEWDFKNNDYECNVDYSKVDDILSSNSTICTDFWCSTNLISVNHWDIKVKKYGNACYSGVLGMWSVQPLSIKLPMYYDDEIDIYWYSDFEATVGNAYTFSLFNSFSNQIFNYSIGYHNTTHQRIMDNNGTIIGYNSLNSAGLAFNGVYLNKTSSKIGIYNSNVYEYFTIPSVDFSYIVIYPNSTYPNKFHIMDLVSNGIILQNDFDWNYGQNSKIIRVNSTAPISVKVFASYNNNNDYLKNYSVVLRADDSKFLCGENFNQTKKDNLIWIVSHGLFDPLFEDLGARDLVNSIFWLLYFLLLFIGFIMFKSFLTSFTITNVVMFIYGFLGFAGNGDMMGILILLVLSFSKPIAGLFQ